MGVSEFVRGLCREVARRRGAGVEAAGSRGGEEIREEMGIGR